MQPGSNRVTENAGKSSRSLAMAGFGAALGRAASFRL